MMLTDSIASYIADEPRPTDGRPENKPKIPDRPIINNIDINKASIEGQNTPVAKPRATTEG
jgi:hypothetical protein